MPNPLAVAQLSYGKRDAIDLSNLNTTRNIKTLSNAPTNAVIKLGLYDGKPCYRFCTNQNKNLRLLLDDIKLKHSNGVAASRNKGITIIHRMLYPNLAPAPNVFDWDCIISRINPTDLGADETDIVFTPDDFGKPHLYPGDSLLIQWDEGYDCEVNISINLLQE